MKPFLKHILFFSMAFIPFYVVMCIAWGELIPPAMSGNLMYKRGGHGHTLARTHEAQTFGPVDLLFFGSSHCFRGFDPRIFEVAGYSMFNLGSNTQTPLQTEVMVNRYIDRMHPKVVILEIYPELFEQEGEESMLDLLSNDTIDSSILDLTFEIGDFRVFHTAGFAWYKQNIAANAPQDQPHEDFGDRYISGGFNEKIDQHFSGKIDVFRSDWRPIPSQLTAFENIINTCRSRNISVVLVQSPILKSMYSLRLDNEKIDEYFSALSVYYNFNELMDFSSEQWFFDAHHLNQAGVARFNAAFLEKLSLNENLINDKKIQMAHQFD